MYLRKILGVTVLAQLAYYIQQTWHALASKHALRECFEDLLSHD